MTTWTIEQRPGSKLNETSLGFALHELVKLGFATKAEAARVSTSPLRLSATLSGIPQERVYADISNEGFIESLFAKFGTTTKSGKGNPVAPTSRKPRRNPLTVPGIQPLPGWPTDAYDPRLESVRAVARGTQGKWGVAVGHYAQGRDPSDVIQRSYERYFIEPVDELIRKRHEYELMLSDSRKGDPFRVTTEPTASGWRYFIWPLPPGVRVPSPYRSAEEAERQKCILAASGVYPARTLSRQTYSRNELSAWLPPESIFQARSEALTRAYRTKQEKAMRSAETEPRRLTQKEAQSTKISPSLLHQYRAVSEKWYENPAMVAAFRDGKPPPK